MYFVTYKTIYLPKSGTGPNNFWRLVSYYSQMKLHVRVLLFENPSELLSLGIVGNGVHEEDVSVMFIMWLGRLSLTWAVMASLVILVSANMFVFK